MTISSPAQQSDTPSNDTSVPDDQHVDIANLDAENANGEGTHRNDANDDDDEMTVIVLDRVQDDRNRGQPVTIDWIEQTGPEMEERRRNVLLRELRRVQRASFIHFVLLCMIPTALLVIVIATVVGEDQQCSSDATYCQLEKRTFLNAFTTRCVCDPIAVDRRP